MIPQWRWREEVQKKALVLTWQHRQPWKEKIKVFESNNLHFELLLELLRRTWDWPDTAESKSGTFAVFFWKKSKTKADSACTVNARVSACLRVPGGPAVVWTRCECLWACLQGVFRYSSFIHLLSNWPPEARWAGREAGQLITPLTPHSPHLTLPDSPAYLSAY